MIDCTVFAGVHPVPHAREALSWDDLCGEIAALCAAEGTATDKRDLPALGLYRLRDGASRSAANVETMSRAIVLDLDGVDIAQLRERLAALRVDALVYGSPSDDAAGVRKARVIVRTDDEHTPAEAGAMRDALAAQLGVQHDPATRNADRLWFVGRLAGTPPRYVERFAGAPLQIATLPRVAPPVAVNPASVAAAPVDRIDAPLDAATLAIIGSLGSWREYAGRKHALCGALGGVLRKTGWTREACAELLRAWLPANEPGVDVAAGVRWACAAWEHEPHEVSGEQALAAIVGASATSVIREAALLPWRVRRDEPLESVIAPAPAPAREFATLERIDLSQPLEPLEYIVPGIDFAPGKCSAIVGYASAAKTPFALALALSIAAGREFVGLECVQAPVAYLDHESSYLTCERVQRIRAGMALDASVPFEYFRADVLSDNSLRDIEALCDHGARVIVHDTYSSAVPPDGSFNDSSFRAWADALGRLSSRRDVLVIALLHTNKGDGDDLRSISGHGSLAGALQAAIKLTRPDDSDHARITVSCMRETRKRFAPFDVRWIDEPCDAAPGGTALVCTRVGAAAPRTTHTAQAHSELAVKRVYNAGIAIVRHAQRGVWHTYTSLARLAGGYPSATREALRALTEAGVVVVQGGAYAVVGDTDVARVDTALGRVGGFQRQP